MINPSAMAKPLPKIISDLYTLFLFTQSDIRIALIPVVMFSIAAAPLASPIQLLETTFWIWLHLLQCNVANQIKAADGTELMQISLTLVLCTMWYNERGGDKDSLSKNFLTAVMYGVSEFGGTLVAGMLSRRDHTRVSPTGQIAAQVTVAIFMSTLHAQDFRDAEGDRLTGRRTFPIAYPVVSRFSIVLAIPFWSILLTIMWQLDLLLAIGFVGYGCYVGARFMLYHTVQDDKLSCKYYCVSIVVYH
ncbi:hypothetical protein EDC04DRAFT_3124655 [Pisolithus marmoratus]|nr:hypothetical protein EDC04DRAFT_3124655 [Pisolithus marmoratus]